MGANNELKPIASTFRCCGAINYYNEKKNWTNCEIWFENLRLIE